MAIFSYKGTDYEFPDTWTDEQALAAIRTDTGEQQGSQPAPAPQPGRAPILGNPLNAIKPWAGGLVESSERIADRISHERAGEKFPVWQNIGDATSHVMGYAFSPLTLGLGMAGEAFPAAKKQIFNTLGDVGKAIWNSPVVGSQIPSKREESGVDPTFAELYEYGKEKYPTMMATARGELTTLGSMLGLGIGGAVGKAGATTLGATLGKTVGKPVGEGLVNFGQKTLAGDLKITKTTAKKAYGKTIQEQKKGIIKTIYEHDLTHGSPAANADAAEAKVSEYFIKADDIVKQIAADPNAPKLNPIKAAMKDIDVAKIADIDLEDDALKAIQNITAKWAEKGYDADVGIDKLIELKQSLNRNGKLFKNAVGQSDADALKQAIKKKMYLNLVDQIGEISPDVKLLNTEAKKLLDAHAALSDASGRIANREQLGLTDWLFGVGAGAGALASPGSLAVTLPLLGAKKYLQYGKGSNMLMNMGRALKGDVPKSAEDVAKFGQISPPRNVDPALKGMMFQADAAPGRLGDVGDDPFYAGLLTPKQYREQKALEAMKAKEIEANTPKNTFTRMGDLNDYTIPREKYFKQKMEAAKTPEQETAFGKWVEETGTAEEKEFWENELSYRVSQEWKTAGKSAEMVNNAKNEIKNSLGLNYGKNRDVRMENLSPKKQMEINKFTEDLNKNTDGLWDKYFEAGLLDKPHTPYSVESTEMISPDQVVQWINEASSIGKKSRFGESLGGMLGNERGIVGGEQAVGWNKAQGKFSNLTDKKPRFEINDKNMTFTEKTLADVGKGNIYRGSLKGTINHPELFRQYPKLKNVDITISPSGGYGEGGSFRAFEDRSAEGLFDIQPEIEIRANTPEKARSSLLHEIQHYIQEKEGFAKGGNPKEITKEIRDEISYLNDNVLYINTELEKNIGTDKYNKLLEERESYRQRLSQLGAFNDEESALGIPAVAYDKYRILSGEIEARDVSARSGLTKAQRSKTMPLSSQGIPLKDMITNLRGNTGLKMLAGTSAAGLGITTLGGLYNAQNKRKGK